MVILRQSILIAGLIADDPEQPNSQADAAIFVLVNPRVWCNPTLAAIRMLCGLAGLHVFGLVSGRVWVHDYETGVLTPPEDLELVG